MYWGDNQKMAQELGIGKDDIGRLILATKQRLKKEIPISIESETGQSHSLEAGWPALEETWRVLGPMCPQSLPQGEDLHESHRDKLVLLGQFHGAMTCGACSAGPCTDEVLRAYVEGARQSMLGS